MPSRCTERSSTSPTSTGISSIGWTPVPGSRRSSQDSGIQASQVMAVRHARRSCTCPRVWRSTPWATCSSPTLATAGSARCGPMMERSRPSPASIRTQWEGTASRVTAARPPKLGSTSPRRSPSTRPARSMSPTAATIASGRYAPTARSPRWRDRERARPTMAPPPPKPGSSYRRAIRTASRSTPSATSTSQNRSTDASARLTPRPASSRRSPARVA